MINEIIKVLILGVIEGVTEWVPVSSTGHLIIMNNYLKLNVSEEFWQFFQVAIQLGAILAALVLYWDKVFPRNWFADSKKISIKKRFSFQNNYRIYSLWLKVIVAILPSVFVGLIWEKTIEEVFYNYFVVSVALIIWGVVFIIVENKIEPKTKLLDLYNITYRQAFIIGIFQIFSIIFPGTSRSGSTIIGGMISGLSRAVSMEFTFILAIPVMFGATLLKLYSFGLYFNNTELIFLSLGSLIAFVVSFFVIKIITNYVKKNDFKIFGYYRIILGILVIYYFQQPF